MDDALACQALEEIVARAPWEPPDIFERPVDLYLAARNLSDDREGSWSFSLFPQRLLAQSQNGLDFAYEHLERWDEVRAALLLKERLEASGFAWPMGYGMSLGFEVFDRMLRSRSGDLSPPLDGEPFRGRHAVAALAFDESTERIVFPNSWGGRWGDHGIGYIGRLFFEAHVDDVILRRPAWLGPSPAMDREARRRAWQAGTAGAVNYEVWEASWATPNSIKTKEVSISEVPHQLRRRMLYSFANGQPFDVVELRLHEALCGRLHAVHDRSTQLTTLMELWVPPDRRRRGYATFLLAAAEELAINVGSTMIRLVLHEADASEVAESRAPGFAAAAGYAWKSTERRRPNLAGQGVRALGMALGDSHAPILPT